VEGLKQQGKTRLTRVYGQRCTPVRPWNDLLCVGWDAKP